MSPVVAVPNGPLARFLRMWRAEHRVSLSELAERTGLSAMQLQKLETGASFNPTIATLQWLSSATETSISTLAHMARESYRQGRVALDQAKEQADG